jgi:15-hydroxyprostaglandin dehydrogenase (NAD)
MEDSTPVALITGGASGMGHAVAEALSRSSWRIAIVDLNADQSEQAFGPSALFIRADVTSYDDQLRAFETIKKTFGRIDFVFANAGVIGKADFYLEPEAWPPKAPSLAAEDICLKGVIYTSYLAMHFMRRNAQPGGVIVMTASGKSI